MRPVGGARDLTQGSIVRALIALAVPISLANVLQTVYQLTDTFWLGRIGAEAVAAVSLSFPVIFVLISLGGGLSVAGAILVAQYQGRGDRANVDHVASQTLLAIVCVSVGLSFVGYLGADDIMRLMGARGALLAGAGDYLQVSFLGLVFLFIYFVYQSLTRGVGDVVTPFIVVLVTTLLNFLADPLFILGWGPVPAMGVGGAAAATVLTQGIAAVIGLALLFSGKQAIRLRFRDVTVPDFPLLRRMVRLGAPAALEQTTRGLGFAVMATLVASYPTVIIAAYGIGSRILSFFVIPALGLSMATSTLVGQNTGAGKSDRVTATARLSLLVAFLTLGAAGLMMFPFGEAIVGAFIKDDPAVVAEGAHFLRILAWSFGFLGFAITIGGVFRGAGNTMLALVMTVLSVWVFLFPVAWILSFRTSLAADGIWWAHPGSYVLSAMAGGLWMAFGRWQKPALTGDDAGEPRGLTANSFTSVSLDPGLVLVCIDRSAETHDAIEQAARLSVNVLAAGDERLSRLFAEGEGSQRFEGVAYRAETTGAPVLDDALAWIDCRLYARHEAGDHSIFVGEVVAADASEEEPLLYYRGGYAGLGR